MIVHAPAGATAGAGDSAAVFVPPRPSGRPPVPWAGARALVATLRERLGDAAVDAALAPRRGPLSLVLRKLPLSEEERDERDRCSLGVLGRLPNMIPNGRVLTEAWADVLAPLLHGAVLVVPALQRLDGETVGVLRALLARGHGEIRLAFAYDPDDVSGDDAAALDAERVAWEASQLAALASEAPRLPRATDARLATDPYDDGLELAAWAALDEPGGPERAAGAARAAFSSYGFPAAWALARAALERAPDHPDAAELHAIAGLALYAATWHVANEIEVERALALGDHLERALALEADPAQRAHLLYRLSVVASRYRGDHEEAKRLADDAVRATDHPAIPPGTAAFLSAWARNGRALARFRLGDLDGAAADCGAALDALARAEALGDVPTVEVDVARFVVADNLARLAYGAGARAEARRWQRFCAEADARIPSSRAPATIWSLQRTIGNNLEGAVRHFEARLARARASLAPTDEAYMSHLLGDCAYRLGRAAEALAHFGVATRLWRRLGADPADLLQGKLNCAISAFRAGRLGESRARFEALLTEELFEGDARADLLGALAWLAGEAGAEAESAARLDEARAVAESDEVRARLDRAEAEAAIARGRLEVATGCLERGLASAAASPAEDRLGLLAGLLALGREEHLEEALRLVPDALADPNAWWDVPRVAAAASRAASAGRSLGDPAARAGFARLLGAALARDDAREAATAAAARWNVEPEL